MTDEQEILVARVLDKIAEIDKIGSPQDRFRALSDIEYWVGVRRQIVEELLRQQHGKGAQ